jgi:hypothetical protein
MALYYSGKGSSDVDKKEIIKLLAAMYSKQANSPMSTDAFYQLVIRATGNQLAELQQKITEYGIALKLAVRTYKFNNHE